MSYSSTSITLPSLCCSDSGSPAAMIGSAPPKRRSSQGLARPQAQNVPSMDRLIQNSPVAASSGV